MLYADNNNPAAADEDITEIIGWGARIQKITDTYLAVLMSEIQNLL
jgi:hypothetical protein